MSITTTATDALCLIASYLDGRDYANLVASHRSMQHLRGVSHVKQNSVYDTMRLLELVVASRQNAMLTGEAGVGKTYTVRKLIAALRRRNLRVRMTASTGAACAAYAAIADAAAAAAAAAAPASGGACAGDDVSCMTVHSFSGLGKGTTPLDAMIEAFDAHAAKHGEVPHKVHQWRSVDVLIIDEVSMIGARLLAKLDFCARRALGRDDPFGGVQVVFVGDWLQMTPVADHFCFTSPLWAQLRIQHVYLTHVYRQAGDVEYARMLKRIRFGNQSEADLARLAAKVVPAYVHDADAHGALRPVRLEALNENVRRINAEEFARNTAPIDVQRSAEDALMRRIPGPNRTSTFVETSEITISAALAIVGRFIEMRAPTLTQFKEGAQYILTRNVCVAQSHTNGATCTYHCAPQPDPTDRIHIDVDDEVEVEAAEPGGYLLFSNGTRLSLGQTLVSITQVVFGHVNLFLRRRQYALRLGYACTFHSSQGMTFDRVIVNLAAVRFAAAAYTGLSRVKSFAGLTLIGFSASSIRTHAAAKAECERLMAACAPALASSSSSAKRARHAPELGDDRATGRAAADHSARPPAAKRARVASVAPSMALAPAPSPAAASAAALARAAASARALAPARASAAAVTAAAAAAQSLSSAVARARVASDRYVRELTHAEYRQQGRAAAKAALKAAARHVAAAIAARELKLAKTPKRTTHVRSEAFKRALASTKASCSRFRM